MPKFCIMKCLKGFWDRSTLSNIGGSANWSLFKSVLRLLKRLKEQPRVLAVAKRMCNTTEKFPHQFSKF